MKNIRIALIIPDFDYGGEEKRVVYFANSYLSYCANVYVIAPVGKSDSLLDDQVKRFRINVRNVCNYTAIFRFMKDENITVLQGHKRASLPILYFTDRYMGIKAFFNFDNIYLKYNKICSYLSPARNVFLSDVLKEFYYPYLKNKFNLTINMGGDMLRKYSDEQIVIIKRQLKIEEGVPIILSLGRLAPQKNQMLLLDALSEFQTTAFICLIVGSGPLELELKIKIDKLGLNGKVRLLGHRSDIEDLLNISDFLVQSSVFEGFPNVFIEAVSVGLPILSTNVGSAKTLVKDNGMLVPSNDCFALTNALKVMIQNLRYFKKEAENMRISKYFLQFSKEQMLKGYIDFINQLVESDENK
ncbi:glycosyltransferase [Sphingobacterium multivorum]|uniref:glycosyltransferase n=1 Tax=Sphingobacterium multivorum TaxID=28454 RepID=UPI003DA55909